MGVHDIPLTLICNVYLRIQCKVFYIAQKETLIAWALLQSAVFWLLYHCMCNWRGYWYAMGVSLIFHEANEGI